MLGKVFFFEVGVRLAWFCTNRFRQEFIWDLEHFYYRRLTHNYKRKQKLVKTVWIATLCVTAIFPLLPLLFSLSLFSTFLSLSILDESPG